MKEKGFIKINTQLFAEDTVQNKIADNEASQENQDNKSNETKEDEKEKTYSEKDIEKMKQKWQEDFEKTKQEEIKKAIKEEIRLSKLSQQDREKQEQEAKKKELEQREQAIIFKERLSEVKEQLIERKLPTEFAQYFVSDDAQKSLEKIKDFEKTFKEAIQNEVNSRIKLSSLSLKTGDNQESLMSDAKKIAQLKNAQKDSKNDPWWRK